METRPIVDNGIVSKPLPPDSAQPERPGAGNAESPPAGDMRFPGEDGGESLAAMAQRDLVATLQLLAERAQYITSATGAAIALRDSGEMTCRASAGTSAPEVGAHLQVDSGLSGESVRSRKTLRCDDAASDPRVNRESCEALGIASVVVMPLVRGNEVIGVFELFSDKPHVFEARDITALERMGAMVYTALEHALSALQAKADAEVAVPGKPAEGSGVAATGTAGDSELQPALAAAEVLGDYRQAAGETGSREASLSEPIDEAAASETAGVASYGGVAFHMKVPAQVPTPTPVADPVVPDGNDAADILEIASEAASTNPSETQARWREEVLGTDASPLLESSDRIQKPAQPDLEKEMPGGVASASVDEQAAPAAPHSEVSSLRRCEGCGFPVSEGRHFCLDCERKAGREQLVAAKDAAQGNAPAAGGFTLAVAAETAEDAGALPQFLRSEPQTSSWLGTHKYAVGAIVVVVAGIVIFFLTH